MELVEAFENGLVEGIEDIDSTIDTHISKLFVGENKVYKIYLKKDAFFGKLSDKEYRKEFYGEDFSWNQMMSPDVYLFLRPVQFLDGKFKIVQDQDAEDYFIEMSLIDTKKSISNLTLSNDLSIEDIENLSRTFNNQIEKLNNEKLAGLSELSHSWSKLWKDRAMDLGPFSGEQTLVSPEMTKRIMNVLIKHAEGSNYIKEYSPDNLSVGIDGHSDNVFLHEGIISFLDIFLVKDVWRIIDPHFDICRIAVDVDAMGQPELISSLYKSSKHNPYDIPKEVRISYELSSAAIKGIYYALIDQEDLAKMYIPLIEKLLKILEELPTDNVTT